MMMRQTEVNTHSQKSVKVLKLWSKLKERPVKFSFYCIVKRVSGSKVADAVLLAFTAPF